MNLGITIIKIMSSLDVYKRQPMYQALKHDKKTRGQMIKMVVVPQLGQAAINQISLEEMKEYLEK